MRGLPWPDEPHLVLWHAQTLLREFRGDGHIAALTVEGLSGAEALVTHGAAGDVPSRHVAPHSAAHRRRLVRCARRHCASGDGSTPTERFTELGRQRRAWIEDRTDELAVAPYAAIGEERCARLRALAKPWSVAMMSALG